MFFDFYKHSNRLIVSQSPSHDRDLGSFLTPVLISEKGNQIHPCPAWRVNALPLSPFLVCPLVTGTGILKIQLEIMDAVEKANAERQRKWYAY